MSDMWTRIGHALDTCPICHVADTHWISVRYAMWRIVDLTVNQRIWIRLGHGGDTEGHDLDTTNRFYGVFPSLGLKKP